jgi:hypothetical protein
MEIVKQAAPPAVTIDAAEFIKINLDYVKHFSALSTGSILLQITFLEKIFVHPRWKVLMAVSPLSFTSSLVGSTVAFTIFTAESWVTARPFWRGQVAITIRATCLVVMWLGFLWGIVALSIFALRNLVELH